MDKQGSVVADSLVRATRVLDREHATAVALRLVGWGEGLTPAGDDFLVGFLAGLDALALDVARRDFAAALSVAVAGLAGRTTDIAAHFLRLAAHADYAQALDDVRDALLCEHRADLAEPRSSARCRSVPRPARYGERLLAALEAWLPSETSLTPT